MKWKNYLACCVVLSVLTWACAMYYPPFGQAFERLLLLLP